jgi:PAS domain S-box-containing protein
MLDRELHALLEHTADAAFTVNDDGEICSWNASAEKLFGFCRDEAVGKACGDLFQGRGPLGRPVFTEGCHVRECVARGIPVPDFDLEVSTRDGRRIWVNLSTVVHESAQTGRRRIVHLARGVADRRRTEQLVRRMLRMSKQLIEMSSDGVRPAPAIPLSEQELCILRDFSQGQSPSDIVRELNISPQTLRNHLHHINQKLGTHNRLEAVIHAIRRQLI